MGVCRAGAVALSALAGIFAAPIQTATAESFFEALFGDGPRYVRPEYVPPHARSYADPRDTPHREPRRHYGRSGVTSGSNGGRTAYCVRTCDGRYFPLPRHAGVSPAQMCHSLCPTSKTMVFSGSRIAHAVAPNGTRYADLKSAFAYRDRVVKNCTCDGKDGLGLAQLDAGTDPTLRPGDIVATNEGFVSYRGKKAKHGQFSPINPSSGPLAQKLSEVRIRPILPDAAATTAPLTDEEVADLLRRELRRAQLGN
jgi:hypothetical protein